MISKKKKVDMETDDDISYTARGAVENIYSTLVVLLDSTQNFTCINQWQNQAEFEMESDEICGFRQIEGRAGEIDLILYYATTTPARVRVLFQGLFEEFLYQQNVEVTQFPPIFCPNGHLQERTIVFTALRKNKGFLFCPECGEKFQLPAAEHVLKPESSVAPNQEALYIKSLELTNIRCFDKFEINFSTSPSEGPALWGMILGDNATGKTTLLRSIALGLCNESDAAALIKTLPGSLIRTGTRGGTIKITLQ